jgi:hypothetical protein
MPIAQSAPPLAALPSIRKGRERAAQRTSFGKAHATAPILDNEVSRATAPYVDHVTK